MTLVLAILMALHQASAPSAPIAGADAPLNCEPAETTPDLNRCAAIDLRRESERMERYLAVAKVRAQASDNDTKSDPAGATLQVRFLDDSQAAWSAYATVVCDGVYDQWKGGTIRGLMRLTCMTAMTQERTHVIWRDYLTYADQTPPILPEPTEPVAERAP